MADVEIKRGYEVLSDNNVRFGIRVINNSSFAISDVEVILDYSEDSFKLQSGRIEKLGTIPPSVPRTAKFVLQPKGCIHKDELGATVLYKDHEWNKHVEQMRPKEVHCVCPFLKEKSISRAEFLTLSKSGYSAESGVNFENIDSAKVVDFLSHTCKNRLYKVDEFPIEGGSIMYLAGDAVGEKAYYLLTAVVKEHEGLTQVFLRANSDKDHGLTGFLNETLDNLRHLVVAGKVREIGVIRKEQVINIIDSVVQRTTFGGAGGEDGASVNIQDSVVQRTEFDAGEDRRVEEERLRIQKEEEDRKAREEAERECQEKERLWQEKKEKQRKEREEQEEKKRQEELRKKQEEEKEILRKKEAQRKEQERNARAERERREREHKGERERAAKEQEKQKAKAEQLRIAKKKGKTRPNIFMLAIVLGTLLVGFVIFAPGSGDTHNVSSPQPEVVPEPIESTSSPQPEVSTPAPSSNSKTYTNSIGMEFVLIPAGSFDMGSPSGEESRYDDEGPVHKVRIPDSFYMGKYEVTQKQWREVMGDSPSSFKSDGRPVETVLWEDAQDFVRKLNQKEGTNKYRLPSEAEWEYAARAGTTTRYSFGDNESRLGEYAWYDANSRDETHLVGQKKPNPWGLYDMHGNVGEWVQDEWHDYYDGAPTDGSVWGDGDGYYRIERGGSLFDNALGCRLASRIGIPLGISPSSTGFRLLRGA